MGYCPRGIHLGLRGANKERAARFYNGLSIHASPAQTLENLVPYHELVVEGRSDVGQQYNNQ